MKNVKLNIIRRLGVLALALLVFLGILTGCRKTAQEPKEKPAVGATVDLMASREDSETESDTDPPGSGAEATVEASEEVSVEPIVEASVEASFEADESITDTSTERLYVAQEPDGVLDEKGSYTSKDDVANYIHEFGHLPDNFITKKEARALGWTGGSLEEYAPGKSIGGDYFGNYEGLLPTKKGRKYYECDIDTLGKKKRGAKRIIFSNDGLVFYTEDHYESFELIYGE